MLKRYVLAGLMLTFAGSAFAEVPVAGRAFIPCVAGAFNCTPGFGQAPVAGGPRPMQPIAGPGIGRPFPGQPGIGRPFPGQPGIGRPFPGQPRMQPGIAGPGGPQGGVRIGVNVNVGVHAGPAMMQPLPCFPGRPCAAPGGVRVRIRGGCLGCGMRRHGMNFGRGCGGGGRMGVNIRMGFGGRRGRC